MNSSDNRSRETVGARSRGPGALLTRWVGDLALGVRLALGGGRTSWARLALTAVGVGLGVAVLLAATSLPHMLQVRNERGNARAIPSHGSVEAQQQSVAGVDPVDIELRNDEYQGRGLQGYVVQLNGPNPPHAPGVDRLPGPGEVVLSPALAELLNSPGGDLLRPRFSQRVIGTIADEGLTGPNELFFYVGLPSLAGQTEVGRIHNFGWQEAPRELRGIEWLLIALGAATFLIPVVVFVATSTRLAASARDRRLAALRLVGADGKQVRRIAAGEAFVGAIAGLFVGVAMFLVARQVVPALSFSALRGGIFAADIRPEWTLIALILVLVPLLSVGVATLSLRRTIIEPLGVVRRGRQGRRKLWWRLIPVVVGVGLLLWKSKSFERAVDNSSQAAVVAGIILLLISVPVILPWVVERVVVLLRGGSPSWQLAIRRLQLDSGTSARVVGGVAVVLTGAIALQTLFIPARSEATPRSSANTELWAGMPATSLTEVDVFRSALGGLVGLGSAKFAVNGQVQDAKGQRVNLELGSCEELRAMVKLDRCAEGDAFYVPLPGATRPSPDSHTFVPVAGQQVWFSGSYGQDLAKLPKWTVPANLRSVDPVKDSGSAVGSLLVTKGAIAKVTNPALYAHASIAPKTPDPQFVEYARNALAPLGWKANVYSNNQDGNDIFLLISRVLNIGSIITLLLAAASLMVVALEQIRERRRALAVLMANGVQRKVLAVSLLWQNTIPIVLGVVIALATGVGLAVLLLGISGRTVALDWPMIAAYCGTGALAVLAVTMLTLPSLWRAASVEGLRGE
ncbi:ABC transporter permease [Kutzneria albida]|uniref:ABC3 transporter permease C-terminal domain-containing protein n=1 Tax=Kutzneria albida DSM 43870 TaxID=1449976 RepID=W5WUD4_9PSEU|nr:ABC transporter permease [Kutzneria albida]AHI01760.1 hypothetical protein KALB_8403 [Kutzneria albida DSM 43870]